MFSCAVLLKLDFAARETSKDVMKQLQSQGGRKGPYILVYVKDGLLYAGWVLAGIIMYVSAGLVLYVLRYIFASIIYTSQYLCEDIM